MFCLMFDGFVQSRRYSDFEEAKAAWDKAVMNTMLYQYDCALVEVDDSGNIVRRVSYEELVA